MRQTNNQRFNALLNGCKHPRRVIAALSAFPRAAARESEQRFAPEDQKRVCCLVRHLAGHAGFSEAYLAFAAQHGGEVTPKETVGFLDEREAKEAEA